MLAHRTHLHKRLGLQMDRCDFFTRELDRTANVWCLLPCDTRLSDNLPTFHCFSLSRDYAPVEASLDPQRRILRQNQ